MFLGSATVGFDLTWAPHVLVDRLLTLRPAAEQEDGGSLKREPEVQRMVAS